MADHPWITGKTVLVTGAAGSIGSVLCARILAYRPAELRCLNLTEHGLAQLAQTLQPASSTMVQYLLGSVLDASLLAQVCYGVDVVIHAAAYKFVEICEQNPCAAVQNNVEGTLQVLHAAQQAGVARCLLISTDKAVRPTSVMGQTKYVAERLVAGMGEGFLTVRLGNILNSAGSVLPRWREQMARCQALTVTDPDCERYFMTTEDATAFLLETLRLPVTQGTFVSRPGPRIRLGFLLDEFLAQYDPPPLVTITGLRPGERLIEELVVGPCMDTAHSAIVHATSALGLDRFDSTLCHVLLAAFSHDALLVRSHLAALTEASDD